MRNISFIIVFLLITACVQEIKPVLKPVEVDISTRIAEQQKWLDQDVAAKAISRDDAKPIRNKLSDIKEKYDRLQSAGVLSAKDSESINKMLDESSESIFMLNQRRQRTILSH